MKKALAMLLAIAMLLTLAACTDDVPQQTQGSEEPTGIKETTLVSAYRANTGKLYDMAGEAYSLNFTYNTTLSGGTAKLQIGDAVYTGEFTCDTDYNINSIAVRDGNQTFSLTANFDHSHRLLSAQVCWSDSAQELVLYRLECAFDARGMLVRQVEELPQQEGKVSLEMKYNEQGILIEQTVQDVRKGYADYFNQRTFAFDENGYLTQISEWHGIGGGCTVECYTHLDMGEYVIYTHINEQQGQKKVKIMDKQGRMLQEESYTEADQVASGEAYASKMTYTYDEAGRMLSYVLDLNGDIRSWENSYTADGRRIYAREYKDGNTITYQETTFITVTP